MSTFIAPNLLVLVLTACQGASGTDSAAIPPPDSSTETTTTGTDTTDTGPDTGADTSIDTSTGADSGDDTQVVVTGPPNLLIVLLDDVGTDKVSSYADDYAGLGYEPEHLPATPVFDSLAAAGVRFTQAWANPQCSPTRAALHTGEHPFRTGVGAPIPPSPELDKETITLAELLGETYRSGLFGKWHLGSSGAATDPERTVDYVKEAVGYTEAEPGTWYQTVSPLLHGFQRFSGGLHSGVCISDGSGACRGTYTDWIQVYGDVSLTEERDGNSQPLTLAWEETTLATEEVVVRTLDWVKEIGAEGPWFASVNFHSAHTPSEDHTVHGCTTSTYEPEDLVDNPGLVKSMVECMDTWLGSLLSGLDAVGELDGTLIVVAGDNGTPDFSGEGPFATRGRGKATAYESGIRVPFVVADGGAWRESREGVPGLAPPLVSSPGRTADRPIHTTDLFATLARAVGIDETSAGQDSVSFLEVLQEPDAVSPERLVYAETFREQAGQMQGWAALVNRDRMKLLVKINPDPGQAGTVCLGLKLFDVANDPLESQDLYGDPAHARVQQELEDGLAALIEEGAGWLAVETPCS